MPKMVLMLLVRHLLTVAGGALVTGGYMSADEISSVGGAVVALAGVGMSVYDKYKNR